MSQIISDRAPEKGVFIFDLSVSDEDDTALVFGDLTNPQWQLMKTDGTIINSRSFANSSMTSLTIVLQGNDLAVFGGSDNLERIVSFSASYTSVNGSGLPANQEAYFTIERLVGQVDST